MRLARKISILALTASLGLVTMSATQATATTAAWNGGFTDFPSDSWKEQWGIVNEGGWGYDRMKAGGDELDVFYGKGSSAPSCTDCPSEGGGQFYSDFKAAGQPDLAEAQTLHLSYQVKFPADFDFGAKGGKLPGLYGGPPGNASGGNHGDAWSTRYMWRIRSDQSKATVYVYDPSQSGGYGKDVGLGAWNWAADGQWHTVQQSVDRQSGTITIWYDGEQVLQEQGIHEIQDIGFAGVFFSTFFGGHATEWGPSRDVHAQFKNFQVNTSKID
ncbi:polysaccharide lyase [Amycolatopsis nigrescens]|uniref:polysaccharide lyase n=1 Tax=Amycolatopsis nigrescens TaxID=381445 RepID=UPI00037C0C63|nr:hypothetical protein [Amycolatopsis nigrescens]